MLGIPIFFNGQATQGISWFCSKYCSIYAQKRRLLPGIIVHAFRIICQAVIVIKDVSKHQKMHQKELHIIQIHCKIVIFAPNIAQFMLKR